MDFSKAFYALMADEGLWHLEHDPRDPGGETVSYTHLDVYKRQASQSPPTRTE